MSAHLTARLESLNPDVIVGVARVGGLCRELFPVRLTNLLDNYYNASQASPFAQTCLVE